jgi:SAM-dependent methyltransferase
MVGPDKILDVGSLREFILGLQAGMTVVSVDVRPTRPVLPKEPYVLADAARLPFGSGVFDAVVSLSALEHFGLGRYGDRFNLSGDVEAVQEMCRVLRPGGVLILTAVVGARAAIEFNAHRIYEPNELRTMLEDLELQEERLMSRRLGRYCKEHELTEEPHDWDFYLGCWKKTMMRR